MSESESTDLRFLDGPDSALSSYLRIEDAVNRLGHQDYPTEWGQLPGWELMPFRRSKKLRDDRGRRRYVRHTISLVGEKARLHSIPIELNLNRVERRACTELYRQVRKTLRHALESGALDAYAAHHKSGKLTPLDRPDIWKKQSYLIFFTGKAVMRDQPAPDTVADVLIGGTAFARWLNARRKSQAKHVAIATVQAVGRIIITHGEQHGYDITLSEAWGLVDGVARQYNRYMPYTQFTKLAWKARGSRAGRKITANKMQKHHATELQSLIAERINSFSAS